MYFVHPNDIERFSLRILLLYRKGLSSFESLRTVNGTKYPSFKEACYALGFLSDDSESKSCLQEASSFASPIQIRDLFVLILLNCTPSNPGMLWDLFKDNMTQDYLHAQRQLNKNIELQYCDYICNKTLIYLNQQLNKSGNDKSNFSNMPQIRPIWQQITFEPANPLITEVFNYNCDTLKAELEHNLILLNCEQKIIFEKIIKRIQSNEYG